MNAFYTICATKMWNVKVKQNVYRYADDNECLATFEGWIIICNLPNHSSND